MGGVVDAATGFLQGIGNTLSGKPVYNAQAPQIDRSQFDPNAQEAELTNFLMARARGEAPSAAEQQMRMGLDQAQRQAASQAAASRGTSSALAARLAQMGQAEMGTQALGQSALLRTQEQARAEQGAGAMLADQRAARAAREELGVRSQLGVEGLRQSSAESAATRQSNLISGLGQAGIIAASDERLKTGIKPGDKEVKSFLDALKAEQYEYKNPALGQGKQVSPMAQDLEKTAIGRQMVIDTPAGKLVDYGKGFGAMLAAQAHLNERLNKVESKKMNAGGMVMPTSRYQNFAQALPMQQRVVDYGQGKDGKMSNEQMLAMANLMQGSGIEKSLAAQQGTSINMTPLPSDDPNGWIIPQRQTPMYANQGAMVPGRAKVDGDSETNDTVPALLSPGELVVPRTVVSAGPEAIKGFAEAILEKERRRG